MDYAMYNNPMWSMYWGQQYNPENFQRSVSPLFASLSDYERLRSSYGTNAANISNTASPTVAPISPTEAPISPAMKSPGTNVGSQLVGNVVPPLLHSLTTGELINRPLTTLGNIGMTAGVNTLSSYLGNALNQAIGSAIGGTAGAAGGSALGSAAGTAAGAAAGAAGGAATGAATGSAAGSIVPGIGTLLGAGIGTGLGFLGSKIAGKWN